MLGQWRVSHPTPRGSSFFSEKTDKKKKERKRNNKKRALRGNSLQLNCNVLGERSSCAGGY